MNSKNLFFKFSGILGLVLLGFGLIAMITNPIGAFVLLHFIGGIVFVTLWFTAGEKEVGVRSRVAKYSTLALSYTSLFITFLIILNWFAVRYDKRFDTSENSAFSLASQSEKILSNLKKPLKLIGFKSPDDAQVLQELLERYRTAAPSNVSIEVIDPRLKVHLVDKYGMKAGNRIYLAYGKDEGEDLSVSRINEISEEAITNAILKLTKGEAQKIYFLQGHGEPDLAGASESGLQGFAGAIQDDHFKIEPLVLATQGRIPEDAAAVIAVAAPRPYVAGERDLLVNYAKDGGRLILFAEPRKGEDIKEAAKEFGIQINNDVVLDQVQRLFSAPAIGVQIVAQTFRPHPIVADFSEQTPALFNLASSIIKVDDADKEATYSPLVESSPTAWGETNLELLFGEEPTAAAESGDNRGPVTLVMAYEKKLKESTETKEENTDFSKSSRVVVFGDSEIIQNQYLGVLTNRDLIMNALSWTLGEEGGVSIRARTLRQAVQPVQLSAVENALNTSYLLAELMLILGLFVWWMRNSNHTLGTASVT
jgi:ABC-type uncharacterized transport system involved in gliding motility auxiliary subunit